MLDLSLHALRNSAAAKSLDPAYMSELESRAKVFIRAETPAVFTLMHLARLSNCPWKELRQFVDRKVDPYVTYEIRKRSGGNRRICAPTKVLRRMQTWVHQNILSSPGARRLIHQSCQAYGPGCSAYNNAVRHAGAAWIVKLDIKDFFESVSERQVFHVFRELGYPPLLAFELARLCTRFYHPKAGTPTPLRRRRWRWKASEPDDGTPYKSVPEIGHLPQGAPTSPVLANLVVRNLDKSIFEVARGADACYTRYADDIVLSLSTSNRAEANMLLHRIAAIVTKAGFRINHKKTHVIGPGARKVVTGLTINDVQPRLPRSMKDEIDLSIYHIRKHGLLSHMKRKKSKNPMGCLNHLHGLIIYAQQVEPNYAQKVRKDLANALESHSEILNLLKELRPQPTSKYMFG